MGYRVDDKPNVRTTSRNSMGPGGDLSAGHKKGDMPIGQKLAPSKKRRSRRHR